MNPEERANSIENHPIAVDLKNNGVISQKLIENCLLVYLHLIEVKHWYDVKTLTISNKQIVFIKGRRKQKSSEEEYVLPVFNNERLTTKRIEEYFQFASEFSSSNRLTLAIVDTSSTILFYEISSGLFSPAQPSVKETKNNEED